MGSAMQVVENWSEITGSVVSREPADRAGYDVVAIEVERVGAVEGYRNLLADAEQTRLAVLVPRELAARHAIGPGDHIRCQVRVASTRQAFVHPEQLTVSRADCG